MVEQEPHLFSFSSKEQRPAIDSSVVTIRWGRARLTPQRVREMSHPDIILLDERISDPVEVVVEGRVVARGEVVVLDEKLCVRLNSVIERK